MDLRDFTKAVARTAVAIAPVYKTGGVALLTLTPGAQPLAPFAAATPPATFLGIGQPMLLVLPEYRAEITRELDPEGGQIDYVRLGELAATAYLTKGK